MKLHLSEEELYDIKKFKNFFSLLFSAKLGEEHAHKVLQFEKKQEAILKERQNTFQEAFEEEIQQYKTHGIKELRKSMIFFICFFSHNIL